jgi:PIN domain nuclease of toxin-antitoxin system
MPQRVLLDTHILLHWAGNSPRLSSLQRQVIEAATAEAPLYLSDITFWEIATLHSLRRISLTVPLRDWLEQIAAPPLIERVRISPAIAAEVAALPDSFHRDPADRLIVASARVMGATLLTQDAKIIGAELVPTLS